MTDKIGKQPDYSTEVQAYLRDESGLVGQAETICFPESIAEIQYAVSHAREKGMGITIQGARTGLCGGAVPGGGMILNLSRMNGILGFAYDESRRTGAITLQAGVTLGQLKELLQKKTMDTSFLSEQDLQAWERYQKSKQILCFLPNPTEQNATLGGIAATAAMGSHMAQDEIFAHHILKMKIVLGSGEVLEISGDKTQQENLELLAFCGTEGTLGVGAELTLKLYRQPDYCCGFFSFHHTLASMEAFYRSFVADTKEKNIQVAAADWFSASCFTLMEEERELLSKKDMAVSFPKKACCALWVELWGNEEQALYEGLEIALEQMETEDGFNELALAAFGKVEMERLESVRHLVTEAANLHNGEDSALLDWQQDSQPLEAVKKIEKLLDAGRTSYVLMGHLTCGANHLRILADAQRWKEQVVQILRVLGCQYGQEHGCGQIKWDLLKALSPTRAEKWKTMKRQQDPEGMLNRMIL